MFMESLSQAARKSCSRGERKEISDGVFSEDGRRRSDRGVHLPDVHPDGRRVDRRHAARVPAPAMA